MTLHINIPKQMPINPRETGKIKATFHNGARPDYGVQINFFSYQVLHSPIAH
jgi:hypothetical protein